MENKVVICFVDEGLKTARIRSQELGLGVGIVCGCLI